MKKKDEGFTSIRIRETTREALRALGTYNDNMDSIVMKCIDAYKRQLQLQPLTISGTHESLSDNKEVPTNTKIIDLGKFRLEDSGYSYNKIGYPFTTEILSFYKHKLEGKKVQLINGEIKGEIFEIIGELVTIKDVPHNAYIVPRFVFHCFDENTAYTLMSEKKFEKIANASKEFLKKQFMVELSEEAVKNLEY